MAGEDKTCPCGRWSSCIGSTGRRWRIWVGDLRIVNLEHRKKLKHCNKSIFNTLYNKSSLAKYHKYCKIVAILLTECFSKAFRMLENWKYCDVLKLLIDRQHSEGANISGRNRKMLWTIQIKGTHMRATFGTNASAYRTPWIYKDQTAPPIVWPYMLGTFY